MRLLFINYEFPPVGGGAAHASLATAREFVAMGHRVDFLTAACGSHSGSEVIDGIEVHRVRARRRGVHESGVLGALLFVALAAGHLRRLARTNHYDAYHFYFGLPTGLLSLLPGAHRGQPYVISLRGSDVPGYDTRLTWLHRLLMPLTRRIWRGAFRVVANSQALRALALTSVPQLRIDVISNGATANPTLPTAARAHSGVRVLTVSRLIARKGLDTLIMALARCERRELSLDIAGEGPIKESLQKLARSCGVADRVRFHGFVDQASLRSLYAQADMFVLASVAESCSMALLEAMAAGLPLVGTRVGGTVELIKPGFNGLLVSPHSVEELTTALQTLAQDPGQRQRFAAANRSLVHERYCWRAVARQYEGIFQESLGLRHTDTAPVQVEHSVVGGYPTRK